MMKRTLLILALLLPASLWGTAYTATQSGNWNQAATWGGAGVPVNGDTFTIGAYTVTVSDTQTAGASGATGTVMGTVQQGGVLIIANSGRLNARGDLNLQRGATINVQGGGTYNFNCIDGATCKINMLATGTGPVNFQIIGAAGNPAVLMNTPQGTTGMGMIDGYTNAQNPVPTFNYFKISGLGGSATRALDFRASPLSGYNTTFTNGLVISSGEVNFGLTNGVSNYYFNNIDFRNCADVNGASNAASCATISPASPTTGARVIQNITAFNTAKKNIYFLGSVSCGRSVAAGDTVDVPCGHLYNTTWTSAATSSAQNVYHLFSVADAFVQSLASVGSATSTPSIIADSLFLAAYPNQHVAGGIGSYGSTITRNVGDGNNYYYYDTGDFCLTTGTCSYNLVINRIGTVFSLLSATGSLNVLNNTSYRAFGGAVGETAGSPVQVGQLRNNLFVLPDAAGGTAANNGIHQNSAFVTQTLGTGAWNYNAFYGMPASGDSGASGTTANLLTNAALGGIVSYVGPASYSAWFTSATYGTTSGYGTEDMHADPKFRDPSRTTCTWYNSLGGYANCDHTNALTATTGTTTTTVYCSTCDFVGWGITSNDWIADYSGSTERGFAQVSAVNSATQITLSSAVPSMASGDTFSFITSTRGIAQQIVRLNGYDYQGNSATWNSGYDVTKALSYIRAGFAPRNSTFRKAGSPADGSPDIGAVDVKSASDANALMFSIP